MDKQLLAALDNLSIALEMLSQSLGKKDEAKSPTAATLSSGNFEDQLKEINKGIQEIKSDNKKILNDTQTIIKLQKEKKDKSMNFFEGDGKEKSKKMLKDGISAIVLIAGAVLAIGLAFKLIGTVDWKSVLAISVSLPMIAYAFENIAKIKDLTPGKVLMIGLSVVGLSIAIMLASRVLSKVVPIGLYQSLTVIFIAAAFGAASFGLGNLLKAFKDIKASDALKASLVLPIVLLAVSVAIVSSSLVLRSVQPIGLFQALTVVLIAAAFGVVSHGLGKLVSVFKDISTGDAIKAAFLMPIILIALSYAIVKSSQMFQSIVPIGLFQALTAILISATFVALSYAVKPLMKGVEGITTKQMVMGTLVLLALTGAVVAASYLLMLMSTVSFSTIAKFLFLSISIALSVVSLAFAVKIVNRIGTPKDYFNGGISIVIMATTIMLSSLMISKGNYTNYPTLSWMLFSGISIAAFALVTWLVTKLGSVKDYVQGGLSIVIIASTIMLTSYIMSAGNYKNYPPLMWSIGTVISIGLFALSVVLLGSFLTNPTFYLGIAVIPIIAASIVAVSYILSVGKYDKYPSMSWVIPTIITLGGFATMAVLLGLVSPLVVIGMATALIITGTIFLIDKLFQMGSYKVYPTEKWSNSTMMLIGKFALMSSVLALAFPFVALGSISVGLIIGMIYLIDKVFMTGKFKKYPDENWQKGVTLTLKKFAAFINEISKSGFDDLIVGSLKIIGLSKSIVEIDKTLNSGKFERYPKKDWVDGSMYALERIGYFVGKQSILGSIVQGVISLFGVGGKSISIKLAEGILQIDTVFSKGNFAKYPKVEWINGTIIALQKFRSIIGMLNFDDPDSGGLFGKISNLFSKSPLEKAVSNITLLAMAFEKLGSSMNTFSNSIQGLDVEKLGLVKSMSNNVIMLSLMDPDMLERVLDKIEERGGIFAELIKDFEGKKETSPGATAIKVTPKYNNQKSEVEILSEKVDRMTALLADISSVVGSKGALKNYLLSVKENQLSSSGNVPNSTNRSDKRLKNILKKVGQSLSGINIYQFTYNFNPRVIYQGVIAQELLNTKFEDALVIDKNGFYSVDYSKLDVQFKKISTSYDF